LPELAIEGDAVTFAPQSLPGHRLLRMHLRNAGPEPVVLHAAELELIDDEGRDLHASCAFGRARDATIGSATIAADQVLSLDFVWRARPEAGIPVAVEVAGATIDLAALATSARPS
jgi:hypothetical protein